MKFSGSYIEGKIIKLGIIIFWSLFWFFNVIDKFVGSSGFLWVGKDRLGQFVEYFTSIGIENHQIAFGFLAFTTIIEIIAFFFLIIALFYFIKGNDQKSHVFVFWGILASLVIFSFFTVGDQIFGDRMELWEHTSYWSALIVSWIAYVYLPKKHS